MSIPTIGNGKICRLGSWHQGKPVFVGYPAGFDFLFVYWYIKHFGFDSPFSFSALDIKTYAMATMKTEYRQSTKKNMPKRWFSDAPHTHIALDDAIEQGKLFCNMLEENTKEENMIHGIYIRSKPEHKWLSFLITRSAEAAVKELQMAIKEVQKGDNARGKLPFRCLIPLYTFQNC